jgi:[ribosomal protein S18]-alanine N-acetyltransferase
MRPETTIQLRGYEPGDLDAMFALDVVCFEEPFRFSRAAMKRFAGARNARVVVAEMEGKLAGFCILHVEQSGEERAGYIVTLDVEPELRRHGLGRWLMLAVEELGLAAGCVAAGLHVFTGNDAAIRFYEGLGYVRSRLAKGFYGRGADAWVYWKRLTEHKEKEFVQD